MNKRLAVPHWGDFVAQGLSREQENLVAFSLQNLVKKMSILRKAQCRSEDIDLLKGRVPGSDVVIEKIEGTDAIAYTVKLKGEQVRLEGMLVFES